MSAGTVTTFVLIRRPQAVRMMMRFRALHTLPVISAVGRLMTVERLAFIALVEFSGYISLGGVVEHFDEDAIFYRFVNLHFFLEEDLDRACLFAVRCSLHALRRRLSIASSTQLFEDDIFSE